MAISEEKMKIVINNYFKDECGVDTSIRQAFEKGFRLGVQKALPAQPKPCEDAVSRQATIDALNLCDANYEGKNCDKCPMRDEVYGSWCDSEGNCWDHLMRKAAELLFSQPEIIHCRDCRWRNNQNGSTAWLPCRAIVTPSDFYCGRAERRTDERSD